MFCTFLLVGQAGQQKTVTSIKNSVTGKVTGTEVIRLLSSIICPAHQAKQSCYYFYINEKTSLMCEILIFALHSSVQVLPAIPVDLDCAS